jgi:biopolymer transport protein ExbB/TolQ
MKYLVPLLVLLLFLPACSKYEKENSSLKEELKMLREENNYLKAEIIGLKKGAAELSGRLKEEKDNAKRIVQEEREMMQKKMQEEREAMLKKIHEAKDPGKKKIPEGKDIKKKTL